jgi:uracil-DNA glycosylase family 4
MSDTDHATEIVQRAVKALQDRGVAMRASSAVLAELAATFGAGSKVPTTTAVVAQHTESTASASKPAKKLTEMFAEVADQPSPSSTTTASPTAARKALTTPSPVMQPSSLAPATGSKAGRLAAMREPVLACTKCPHLVRSRTQVVFGVGNPEAELMFVGEAPGADEDAAGEPFVGKAGQLLTKIIETMGLKRSDVYIANVLKCRPDMPEGSSGNRKPTGPEMNTCKPYLLEQIQIIQPKVIVGLGATAMEGLLGADKFPITRNRGTWHEFAGIPLMPTFHPAYLLRNQALSEKRRVWEDMLAVLETLKHPISDKQRGFFLSK